MGNFLKKHREMKKRAQAAVLQEEEEKKQQLLEEQRQAAEAKRKEEDAVRLEKEAVEAAKIGKTIKGAPKRKKLTLLERAQQKINQEEQKK